MSAALRGMVSDRSAHDPTTRRPIIKAYGLKDRGVLCQAHYMGECFARSFAS